MNELVNSFPSKFWVSPYTIASIPTLKVRLQSVALETSPTECNACCALCLD